MKLQTEKPLEKLNTSPAKPFFKWAGGKGQLLEKFRELYPKELLSGQLTNYYEPFAGGGAVFFDLAQTVSFQQTFLYDINQELILVYKVIQNSNDALIDILDNLEKSYLPMDAEERKIYYYGIRDKFNRGILNFNYQVYNNSWIERAAQSIFLNKTCYNGLFRFNNTGGFNTPAGNYKNPRICDKRNIKAVSALLKNSVIKCAGFEDVLNDIDKNAFVYFDPPYRPLNKTSGFTAYSKYSFTDEDQKKLAAVFAELDGKGCKLMLSNSDPKNSNPNDTFFDELYKDFNIHRIQARRNINSVASKRGLLSEIVVTNY